MKRNLMFRIINMLTVMAIGLSLSANGTAFAADTPKWDKTFPLSDKVIHEKVSFHNRYGIIIAADMYLPKDIDKSKKYAAIIVGTPFVGYIFQVVMEIHQFGTCLADSDFHDSYSPDRYFSRKGAKNAMFFFFP